MGKKETFKKENPALSYISQAEELPKKPPKGYKFNPEFIEVKSKRVQLLLQPSVVDAIKELAEEKGLSMNETINEAIKEYLKRK